MEQFPEFVTAPDDVTTPDDEEDTPSDEPQRGRLTGWEQVVFEVEDESEPVFTAAASAP